MAEHRYLFYDFSTHRLIDALPMSNVSYGWEISGVGTFTGSIPLYADDLPAERVRDAIHPYRTKIFVERDHQLVWGGWIHQEPQYDSASGTVTVQAEESLGYFAQRFMPTITYTGQDQLDIARSIIGTLQAQPGGDMWIVTDPSVISTVLRDRTYSQYDQTPGLQALTQLSEVINGFEFCLQTSYDGTRMPRELLILGYPQIGRRGADSGIALEYDRFTGAGNIESFTWGDAGVKMATKIWASTETEEGVQLTATAERPDLIADGYPLMEGGENFDGVVNFSTLENHASALLAYRAGVRIAAEATVKEQPSLRLPDILLGDDALVRLSDWRFPPGPGGAPGLTDYLRIVALSVTPGDGIETYTLTLADFLSPL